MTFSPLSVPVALLLTALAHPTPPPQQAPAPGGLRFLVTLVAKTEHDRRIFEARVFRLEQVFQEQAKAGQDVEAKLAKLKEVRAAHMQRYLKAMEGLNAKFGEDGFAKFRIRMEHGRKRTPENAEVIARSIKAAAEKKAANAGGGK
ncbi:MAG: hypothetical protein EPO68_17100 [Planctomycetota bacterium]|nr:MAG: hypothetical protein EPO68_17100 [Planctomycetota bacterium]